MGLSEHPVVVGMSNRLVRIERLRNLRDDLRDACETVSQRAIKVLMGMIVLLPAMCVYLSIFTLCASSRSLLWIG